MNKWQTEEDRLGKELLFVSAYRIICWKLEGSYEVMIGTEENSKEWENLLERFWEAFNQDANQVKKSK